MNSNKNLPYGSLEYWIQVQPCSNLFTAYGKIYSLSDKEGNAFYVGSTVSDIEKRVYNHISEAKRKDRWSKNNPKNIRIVELNYEVVATIIDIKFISGIDAFHAQKRMVELEKRWIFKYIELGYALTNREAISKVRKENKKIPEFIGQTIVTSVDLKADAKDGLIKIIEQSSIK